MGVKELWNVLAPAEQEVPLESLKGKTIAIDLSVWICETAKAVQGKVAKPYLRNLFYRVAALLQLDVKLIFVADGKPPDLKRETILNRINARRPQQERGHSNGGNPGQSISRCYFERMTKECLEMLDCLGVPYVQSTGDAEAMCALLNEEGIVDACITGDSDIFLYGAKWVYRNFSISSKNISSYKMADIEQHGYTRETLVALALLLGCDFSPKGVPGVGKVQAVNLVNHLKGQSLLERFRAWSEGKVPYEKFTEPMGYELVLIFNNFFTPDCTTGSQVCGGIYSRPLNEGVMRTPKATLLQISGSQQASLPPHCSRCHHVGTAKNHKSDGCPQCGGTCLSIKKSQSPPCSCNWHQSSVERDIIIKAEKVDGFPDEAVIDEFLVRKDVCPRATFDYARPVMLQMMPAVSRQLLCRRWNRDTCFKQGRHEKYCERFYRAGHASVKGSKHCKGMIADCFQAFAMEQMSWSKQYARSKAVPLVTLYDLKSSESSSEPLFVDRIVKKRIKDGVPCLEVEWKLPESWMLEGDESSVIATVERRDLFQSAHPQIVADFEAAAELNKKSKKKAKPKSKTIVDMFKRPECSSTQTENPAEADHENPSPPKQAGIDSSGENNTVALVETDLNEEEQMFRAERERLARGSEQTPAKRRVPGPEPTPVIKPKKSKSGKKLGDNEKPSVQRSLFEFYLSSPPKGDGK